MLAAPVTFSHVAAKQAAPDPKHSNPVVSFYFAQSVTIEVLVPPVYVLQAPTATQVVPEKYVQVPEVGIAP